MRYDKVSVPAQVLQDLLWNIELIAGSDHTMMTKQREKLQKYLDESMTDTSHVATGKVVYANFGGK